MGRTDSLAAVAGGRMAEQELWQEWLLRSFPGSRGAAGEERCSRQTELTLNSGDARTTPLLLKAHQSLADLIGGWRKGWTW